jgi:RimJ/RimL family protein N-acetyltransferase
MEAGSIVVPSVETARLTFGGRGREDFAEYASMWGDADVTRHIGGKPFSHEDSWGRFLRTAGHWPLLGFGYWLVRDKSTGRLVGEVGFANLKREIVPTLGDVPEIGWVLASCGARATRRKQHGLRSPGATRSSARRAPCA